jgi:hypothetical protein
MSLSECCRRILLCIEQARRLEVRYLCLLCNQKTNMWMAHVPFSIAVEKCRVFTSFTRSVYIPNQSSRLDNASCLAQNIQLPYHHTHDSTDQNTQSVLNMPRLPQTNVACECACCKWLHCAKLSLHALYFIASLHML